MLLLIALVLAVFWKATTGGIFYFGDILQLHYPLRSAYARELSRLALPLWSNDVLAGYPLLAEGQLGALYPPNLILYALLPVPIALNLFILGHFVLAGLGAFVFARHLTLRRVAALCCGLVYALGGFLVAHLNHVNILACAAWFPWLLLLTDRLLLDETANHMARDQVLLGLAVGMECLAGHVQMALLTLLAVAVYGMYLAWIARPRWRRLVCFVLAGLLGVALAAAQLLPSYELTELSVRAGGLDPTFFTSFSLHPLYLASLFSPFVLGNPYPNTSVELVGYVGWLSMLAAGLAPFVVKRAAPKQAVRRVRFFVALAVVALLLALGRWNPLYMLLLRVPPFNLFRVPARYLYLFTLSAAVLAGYGIDALLARVQERAGGLEGKYDWLVVAVVAILVLVATSLMHSVDDLVRIWRWLPFVLSGLSLVWMALAWWARGLYKALSTLAMVLVVVDLVAFNAVYSRTYNQTMTLQEFTAIPRSLSFFRSQPGLYRVYTTEDIVPAESVMRESYYPNLSLIQNLPSSNGNFPLVPARYARYTENMTSRMLDLLGIKYVLIPQVLPVDEAREFYDLENRFALNPVGRSVDISPTLAVSVEVESYLSHSVDWADGQPVAEIRLLGSHEEKETITLCAGWHTSEWAYDRSDVSLVVRHSQAAIVRAWPARSGFPPEDHRGFTYGAQFQLAAPMTVVTVEVRPFVPFAYLRIDRMTLIDAEGNKQILAHLANQGDQTLVYRSEDVAVYENHDALPKALIVHAGRAVSDDDQTLQLLRDPTFDPRAEVLLSVESVPDNPVTPQVADQVDVVAYDSRKVVIRTRTAANGYLLLTDAWYPGWMASVDGKSVPIWRADLIFRAVQLSAGEHSVEFTYDPISFRIGLWISGAALLALLGWGMLVQLGKRRPA